MGESTSGVDTLRYIYFTEESYQNGPKCHSCMNDDFCSTELDAIEHVFVMTEAGLVPFLIRSLVFLYGMDTPFSLKNISERLFITQCLDCSMSRDLPVAGDAEFCGTTQETSQVICETERERGQDVVTDVVERMLPALSNSACKIEKGFLENLSGVSRGTEISGECSSRTELIQTEHEESSNGDTGVTHSAARDNSSQAAVPSPRENRKRMGSEDAVIGTKRVKTDIDENVNSGMIIKGGNREGDQVQTDAIHNEDREEARNSASTLLANSVSKHHATQPPSSTCSAFPSAKDHCEPEEPPYVIPLNIVSVNGNGKFESMCATSTLEKLPEPTDEWFPFIRGRCRSAVADPITFDDYQSLREWMGGDGKDNPLNFVLAEKFNNKKTITCFACNIDVPLTRNGFRHFLGKRHFKSIRKKCRVFSKSEDLLKLEEWLSKAKKTKEQLLIEEERIQKLRKEAKEKKDHEKKVLDYEAKKKEVDDGAVFDSKINGINFPFLRGSRLVNVLSPIFLTDTMQNTLDAISSEVESNAKFRSLARQTYFRDQSSHRCDYCNEDVNVHDLFVHFLSAPHLQKVLYTGEVFCKIRDYDEIRFIFEKLKRKVNGWRLPSDSRLPFGYGKSREDNLQFVTFEDIFNCITAMKKTGKLNSGFSKFLIEHYRDAAEVDMCSHCGPLVTENSTAIPHFLSIKHIAKAMKIGKVFVKDLTVLKNLFHSYLQNSNCPADLILQSVEYAIQNKIYSNGSMEFAQLSNEILTASKLRQTLLTLNNLLS